MESSMSGAALRAALLTSVLTTMSLGLAGCSTLISKPPPPAAPLPAPSRTEPVPASADLPPDAVPRVEPRSRFGNPASYEVFGKRYAVLTDAQGFSERGTASWYGPGFHGERTSSGEPYDMYGMTAAHKTLPLPAYVRVDNLSNGRSVVVRVNDRGPFVGDRIIDLSYSAAAKLDMLRAGTAPVEITVLEASTQTAAPAVRAPVTTIPPEPVAPSLAPQYVQAGAFGSRENAERQATQLRNAGFSNITLQPSLTPVASAAESDDIIERLALAGIPDARLVHTPLLQ
jgi:rare lipoprotein A